MEKYKKHLLKRTNVLYFIYDLEKEVLNHNYMRKYDK